ncbi:hypothetical protein [Streptacidiphilus sp. EB103A]|uniref:hypothetical protein n=1 Tax=Streptacidiphilus sp. EB103A TaxID=3156275 RepID=UPI003513A531
MTVTADRLNDIARSLNRRQWLPTADEVAFGSTFLRRMGEVEQEGAGFPRGANWWDRLHTESFHALTRTVELLEVDLLPCGRARLPGSPIVELAELWLGSAQPLLPHAQRLLTAWHDAAPPEPTADMIARTARRLNVTDDLAEGRLRYEDAAHWEREGNALSLWDELRPLWAHLGAVRSTMTAAVTGDTEY